MNKIEVVLAEKNNDYKVSELFKIMDTENIFPSNIDSIDKHIEKKECYVAILDGKIIGAMLLLLDDESYKIDWIASCEKGGGSALVNFAINKCLEENIQKLWCWSLVRYGARGFYEKMGFSEIFILEKQWHGEDCYFFGKVIDMNC